MEKTPNHVPCPVANTDACPIFLQEGECYEDKHHQYWPSNAYRTGTEKQFRQLEDNKVQICRWLHNTIHAVALEPAKPSLGVMREAIRRERERRQ